MKMRKVALATAEVKTMFVCLFVCVCVCVCVCVVLVT